MIPIERGAYLQDMVNRGTIEAYIILDNEGSLYHSMPDSFTRTVIDLARHGADRLYHQNRCWNLWSDGPHVVALATMKGSAESKSASRLLRRMRDRFCTPNQNKGVLTLCQVS